MLNVIIDSGAKSPEMRKAGTGAAKKPRCRSLFFASIFSFSTKAYFLRRDQLFESLPQGHGMPCPTEIDYLSFVGHGMPCPYRNITNYSRAYRNRACAANPFPSRFPFKYVRERLEEIDRDREERGRIVFRGDFGERLQVAQLHGNRLFRHDGRGLGELL